MSHEVELNHPRAVAKWMLQSLRAVHFKGKNGYQYKEILISNIYGYQNFTGCTDRQYGTHCQHNTNVPLIKSSYSNHVAMSVQWTIVA
jgi:hypothetical protein